MKYIYKFFFFFNFFWFFFFFKKYSLNTPRQKVIYLLMLESPKVAKLEEAKLLKVKAPIRVW